ncbi:C-type lectin domain containing ema isoform X2 [Lycorma delicatula]|uniref:C-type lectin domain containing ema isoform X2 n=1 Tax=Lycorma delicatula TaxID=130591 RepID=UPI003F513D35
MFRSKSWFGGVLWKPKNPHSLEHLKYLYNVLSKNQTVSENNRGLLVETLRSIAEILIWGDQNDSSVFDFFLEKNMLSFFLKILKQKCGSYVCVQLLQTLNILFENIRKETSLYYLLSNNHVNLIIVHKFDFSDEEVMAYYISFLKTLSLKLNAHTVHFFYNEHTNDFPLYTEAIKFFKHPESMVRIAVRTLTLNVYKVEDKSMLKFIRNKTAAPYFSNLVWFIGNHVLELDSCVRNDADHLSQNRLADLVAEHLDHLHYLNDILSLNIEDLNEVLTDHLLNRLFIPLYVFSLLPGLSEDGRPKMSSVVSLFLLSQVFLISSQRPLVNVLAEIILRGTADMLTASDWTQQNSQGSPCLKPGFVAPTESLEESLDGVSNGPTIDTIVQEIPKLPTNLNITDEEKERLAQGNIMLYCTEVVPVFLEAITSYLVCLENDYSALFALCLLHAISHNPGVDYELLDTILLPSKNVEAKQRYNTWLVEKLIDIITLSCQPGCGVRLVTLELTIAFLLRLVVLDGTSLLHDCHLAAVVGAKEESTSLLRNFYKSEDIFLDMFEDEYEDMKKRPLNVEWLMMDSNVLLPPTGTPMTGIEFTRRLPCGEVERARRAIRVFLLVRELSLTLAGETESQLPLTNRNACVQVDNVLDLNNSDLIACTVVNKDGTKMRRFLVMDSTQLILVEPDNRRLGWGVAKMAGFLQDMEVIGDKDDSRCLHITIHHTTTGPLIAAKFVFDDHIRCMAAKQRLTKGRLKARQKKMIQIARLLELPSNAQPTPSPPTYNLLALRQSAHHHRIPSGRSLLNHRPPGFAAVVKPPSSPKTREKDKERRSSNTSSVEGGTPRSREGSPKLPRPRSEEIPLEDITTKRNSLTSASTSSAVETQVESVSAAISNTTLNMPSSSSSSIETSFSSNFPEQQDSSSSINNNNSSKDKEQERRKGKVETV